MPQLDSRYLMLISSRLAGRAVDVLVGEEKEIFSVHEKLIRASSPFFDKAVSGIWLESTQHTIELPEDEPEIFGIYVHWLYYEKLPVSCNEPSSEYLNLMKAYTLGDKLLDTKFQDTVIDAIVDKSVTPAQTGACWYPTDEEVEFAFNNTSDSAPIRTLLVDLYVFAGCSRLVRCENPADVPQPFLYELALKLLDQRDGPRQKIEASKYHVCNSKNVKAEPKTESP